MRPSQKNRNSRNKSRGGNKPLGNVVNRVFESAGPEGKVRGTPQQIIDKYLLLARDAQTSSDRVMSENFLQHAEHYARMLNAAYEQAEERRQQQTQTQNGYRQDSDDGVDEESDGGWRRDPRDEQRARDEREDRRQEREERDAEPRREPQEARDEVVAQEEGRPEPRRSEERRRRERPAPRREGSEASEAETHLNGGLQATLERGAGSGLETIDAGDEAGGLVQTPEDSTPARRPRRTRRAPKKAEEAEGAETDEAAPSSAD